MINNHENLNLFLRANPDLKNNFDTLKTLLSNYIKNESDLTIVYNILDEMVSKKFKTITVALQSNQQPSSETNENLKKHGIYPTEEEKFANIQGLNNRMITLSHKIKNLTGKDIMNTDNNENNIIDALEIILKTGTYKQASEVINNIIKFNIFQYLQETYKLRV